MSEFIEIHWSSGSIDEARTICRDLVQERLVAAAQIIPWIESIYKLNNSIETTQESKIILKTSKSQFKSVQDFIIKNCKYEIPEIVAFDLLEINPSYLAWMEESMVELKKIL